MTVRKFKSWNEKFEFVINDIRMPGDLEITISNERNSGTGRRSSFLGKVTIPISSVPQTPELRWYPLQKRGMFSNIKGDLGLRISWQAGEQVSKHRVDQEVGGGGGGYVPDSPFRVVTQPYSLWLSRLYSISYFAMEPQCWIEPLE